MDPQLLGSVQSLLQQALDISKWAEPPRWRIIRHRKWRRDQQPEAVARRLGDGLRGEIEPVRALIHQAAAFITDLEARRREETGSVWVLYSFTESSCRILEGVYRSPERAVEHGNPGMYVGRVNFDASPELGRGVEIFDWEEL